MSELSDLAKNRIEEMITFMGLNVEAKAEETEDGIGVDIDSPASAKLIGHHGETLRSLEYLANQMMKRVDGSAPRVSLDIAGYREGRRESLVEMAREVASRVKESGHEESLKPMNPADRRIVHLALQEDGEVTTESRGEDRGRHLVIMPVN